MNCCFVCGAMNALPYSIEVTVQGVVARQPGMQCSACGEFYSTLAEVSAVDVQVARELSRREPSAAGMRYMRHVLGLSGVECAAMLGVQPETVSRWEHGARKVSRIAWRLMGAKLEAMR